MRVLDDALGHRAEYRVLKPGAAVRAHDDEIDLVLARRGHDQVLEIEADDVRTLLHFQKDDEPRTPWSSRARCAKSLRRRLILCSGIGMNDAQNDLIPSPTPATTGLEGLIALFHDELKAVQFPGLDAKVLDAAAERVHAAACEVRRCEAELEAARAQLAVTQEDALQKGQRALAYARVYAQDAPELLARLASVALRGIAAAPPSSPTAVAPAAPRKRGRPPKSATVTSLFGQDHVRAAAADDGGVDDVESAPLQQ